MEKIKATLKKKGDLLVVALPKEIVKSCHMKEGTEVTITIEPHKKMTVGDLMEFAKKHPYQSQKRATRNF